MNLIKTGLATIKQNLGFFFAYTGLIFLCNCVLRLFETLPILILILSLFFVPFLMVISYLSSFRLVTQMKNGIDQEYFKTIFNIFTGKYFKIILTIITILLIFLALALIIFALGFAITQILPEKYISTVFFICGVIMFLSSFYIYLRFQYTYFYLLIENQSIVNSIKLSLNTGKSYIWNFLGVLILYAILLGGILFVSTLLYRYNFDIFENPPPYQQQDRTTEQYQLKDQDKTKDSEYWYNYWCQSADAISLTPEQAQWISKPSNMRCKIYSVAKSTTPFLNLIYQFFSTLLAQFYLVLVALVFSKKLR